jgi:hypothetical protein
MGCRKAYDVPEYAEISNNETGFLVPLEGQTSDQAQFASLDYLKAQQVATKRVQITHRWNQTGRWEFTGEWIPNVRLIKVDRSPVTREWTAEAITGTGQKNEAIWAESKDSIGFSTGISITARVKEDNAAQFLYLYPSANAENGLAKVLDTEARARVQSILSDFGAKYDMSELRALKSEMMNAVRKDLLAYYKDRGIDIPTIAQFGGFAYENKKVQESIDAVFISQREKEIAAALLEAQRDKNLRITQEADALANKERTIAKGIADGKASILGVAEKAAQNPVFLEMQRLEVMMKLTEKWNGQYPQFLMNSSSGGAPPMMLLNITNPKN